jgi:hypothetical protein
MNINPQSMVLIHPPVVKPCEPPPGIARLCGALSHHGMKCRVVDANLEGLLNLLDAKNKTPDTWTRRANKHLSSHLSLLRSWEGYRNIDRYTRAIKDTNRVLEKTAKLSGPRLTLGNYEHENFSPTRSDDLIRAAENPETDPFYPYFEKRMLDLLEHESPSFVGFSLNYLSQALTTFAMAGFLKRINPRLTLVLGGGLITSWMRRPGWSNPFVGVVDHLVAGPGELPLLALLGVDFPLPLEGGGRGGGEQYAPDYSSFPTKDYFAPGFILPYSASTGCYWSKCSFCPEEAEGNEYIPTPVRIVIEELRFLVEKHKPGMIHLTDNAVSPVLLKSLSKDPPGAPWYGFVRFIRDLTDLDFCVALKKSGCVMLKLGLESGDQGVLDAMEKGINLEEASSALRAIKKAGIATYVYLLFGTPPESLTEARKTLDFVVKDHEEIDFLNVAIFNLPVYGPDTESLQTRIFYEGDLSLYVDFDHPRGWTRKAVRQFLDKEFKRHPAIAPILRRDPPVFTSNHAPFFVMR